MKIVDLVTLLLFSISCGGGSRAVMVSSHTSDDQEILGSCLGDQVLEERICIRRVSDLGAISWKQPLGATAEFDRAKHMLELDPADTRLIKLLTQMIERPNGFKCSGNGCEGLQANYECEAQMGRMYRAKVYITRRRFREAFLDLSVVVQSGRDHFMYEEIPGFFKELEKAGFSKTSLAVCLSVYEWPRLDILKGRDRHWKPYTKDDPAPKW